MTSMIGSNMSESLKKAAMAGLMALIVVGVTASSSAQQVPLPKLPRVAPAAAPAAKPAVAADDEEEAPKPRKGGGEGIHVIGHWVMDLKDKDGKLVEHRDFHNALIDPSALVGLLTGYFSASTLEINLFSTNTSTNYDLYPVGNNASATSCAYLAAYYAFVGNASYDCIPGLIQTAILDTTNGSFYSGIKLQGQIAPASGDVISFVSTRVSFCAQYGTAKDSNSDYLLAPSTTSPAACSTTASSIALAGNVPGPFTSAVYLTQKDLTAAPLTILPGQTLSVTVTLSFN